MSTVRLYVYDLSNGLARQMSLQLTGRQIDGIWRVSTVKYFKVECSFKSDRHTSVVVFGKEIFYGQGICTTAPGQSHVSGANDGHWRCIQA